jgi:mycoredoxin
MTEPELVVYATGWCGDCRRARSFLDDHALPYRWVDIDHDPDGEKLVRKLNRGNRSVPTLIFPDGSILVEPSTLQLKRKFGLEA